jgi:hypothetical protein
METCSDVACKVFGVDLLDPNVAVSVNFDGNWVFLTVGVLQNWFLKLKLNLLVKILLLDGQNYFLYFVWYFVHVSSGSSNYNIFKILFSFFNLCFRFIYEILNNSKLG